MGVVLRRGLQTGEREKHRVMHTETCTGGLQPLDLHVWTKVLLARMWLLCRMVLRRKTTTHVTAALRADGGQKQRRCLCGSEKADDWLPERKSGMAERQWCE